MLYVIYAELVTSSKEQNISIFSRTGGLAKLQLLQDQGRLLTAGLTPIIDSYDFGQTGLNGYMVIAEFDSLESAHIWIKTNSYFVTSSDTRVIVKPYIRLLP